MYNYMFNLSVFVCVNINKSINQSILQNLFDKEGTQIPVYSEQRNQYGHAFRFRSQTNGSVWHIYVIYGVETPCTTQNKNFLSELTLLTIYQTQEKL